MPIFNLGLGRAADRECVSAWYLWIVFLHVGARYLNPREPRRMCAFHPPYPAVRARLHAICDVCLHCRAYVWYTVVLRDLSAGHRICLVS